MRHQELGYNLPRRLLGTDIAVAAMNETRSSPPTNGDDNFDGNVVIILAILLCALIFVLGINSIVRCALRCGRGMTFETAEGVAVRLTSTGLTKDALHQIPVVVFKSGINIPATDCPICLGEFTEGQKVKILPGCNHGFHVKCIDAWLASHSSCPNCRQLLFGHPNTAATSN